MNAPVCFLEIVALDQLFELTESDFVYHVDKLQSQLIFESRFKAHGTADEIDSIFRALARLEDVLARRVCRICGKRHYDCSD